jgi:hypothetical protein
MFLNNFFDLNDFSENTESMSNINNRRERKGEIDDDICVLLQSMKEYKNIGIFG